MIDIIGDKVFGICRRVFLIFRKWQTGHNGLVMNETDLVHYRKRN